MSGEAREDQKKDILYLTRSQNKAWQKRSENYAKHFDIPKSSTVSTRPSLTAFRILTLHVPAGEANPPTEHHTELHVTLETLKFSQTSNQSIKTRFIN